MAILKQVQAEIIVNDNVLTKYDDIDSNHYEKTTTAKYIEAISEATFEINLSTKKGFRFKDYSYTIHADGLRVCMRQNRGNLSSQVGHLAHG